MGDILESEARLDHKLQTLGGIGSLLGIERVYVCVALDRRTFVPE